MENYQTLLQHVTQTERQIDEVERQIGHLRDVVGHSEDIRANRSPEGLQKAA
jgi:hypothetical protein